MTVGVTASEPQHDTAGSDLVRLLQGAAYPFRIMGNHGEISAHRLIRFRTALFPIAQRSQRYVIMKITDTRNLDGARRNPGLHHLGPRIPLRSIRAA